MFVTEFECKEAITTIYPLSAIRLCIKALGKAEHTRLRINQEGMLSLQHVIQMGETSNWVEFFILSKEPEEERPMESLVNQDQSSDQSEHSGERKKEIKKSSISKRSRRGRK